MNHKLSLLTICFVLTIVTGFSYSAQKYESPELASLEKQIVSLENQIAEIKTTIRKFRNKQATKISGEEDRKPMKKKNGYSMNPRIWTEGQRGWIEDGANIWTSLAPVPTYNVGIGTSSPQGKLHVERNLAAGAELITLFNPSTSTNAYEFLRLGQSNIYWGIMSYDNEDKELSLQSNINSSEGIALVTQTAAPIKFITGLANERMRIKGDGNVGIGTSTPWAKLEVAGIIRADAGDLTNIEVWADCSNTFDYAGIALSNGFHYPATRLQVYGTSYTEPEAFHIRHYPNAPIIISTNNAERMRITGDGNVAIGTTNPSGYLLAVNGTAAKPGGGSWSVFSDGRLKDVKGDYTCGLEEIEMINPVYYKYKENNELGLPSHKEFIGVVAQEIQPIIKDAVEANDSGYLLVDNDPIIWAMLNAIKELKRQNDLLNERVEELEKRSKDGN